MIWVLESRKGFHTFWPLAHAERDPIKDLDSGVQESDDITRWLEELASESNTIQA